MKRKSAILKALTVLLLVVTVTAFTFILSACDRNTDKPSQAPDTSQGDNDTNNSETPNTPQVPETPSTPQTPVDNKLTYSQTEHIGWEKSLSNFSNSAYSQYYSNGKPAFVTPGLNEGQNFVLQGVAYCEAQNWALLCGYINPKTDKSNSVIFVIDMNKKAKTESGVEYSGALIKEIFLQNTNGSVYDGHAGGITATAKNVWIANGKKLHRIPMSDIVGAPESSEIKIADSIKVPVLSSYCNYSNGILWVGEFEYAKEKYNTDSTHHSGVLTAWTVGYVINEDGGEGYDSVSGFKQSALGDVAIPDYVLWHGEKVQGMAEVGGKIVLSTSYGRKYNSNLYIYDNPVRGAHMKEADCTVTISGVEVPCYYLSEESEKIVAPPMTEDLAVLKEGEQYKIFVASESGAYYYYGYNFLSKANNPTDFVWELNVEQ